MPSSLQILFTISQLNYLTPPLTPIIWRFTVLINGHHFNMNYKEDKIFPPWFEFWHIKLSFVTDLTFSPHIYKSLPLDTGFSFLIRTPHNNTLQIRYRLPRFRYNPPHLWRFTIFDKFCFETHSHIVVVVVPLSSSGKFQLGAVLFGFSHFKWKLKPITTPRFCNITSSGGA